MSKHTAAYPRKASEEHGEHVLVELFLHADREGASKRHRPADVDGVMREHRCIPHRCVQFKGGL